MKGQKHTEITKQIDILITDGLEKQGFTVLRFWESDIKSNIVYCIKVVKGVIHSCL